MNRLRAILVVLFAIVCAAATYAQDVVGAADVATFPGFTTRAAGDTFNVRIFCPGSPG